MLNKNCLFISNDFNDVRGAIANGITVVALVDNADDYRFLNCVIMGVLLPPYESLSAEIDGNKPLAAQIYYQFLFSKLDIFANLLAAIYRGKRLLLFVPEDESMNFGFVNVLISFFAQTFGITPGIPGTSECIVNDGDIFSANIADTMFVNGLINIQEYCILMPASIPPSENACGRLMQFMNYRFDSMQQCVQYCTQYIAACKPKKGELFSPAFRVNLT